MKQRENYTPSVKSLFKNTYRADMCDLYCSDTWDMSLMRIKWKAWFKMSDSPRTDIKHGHRELILWLDFICNTIFHDSLSLSTLKL